LKASHAEKTPHAALPTKGKNAGKARAGYGWQGPHAFQNDLEELCSSSEIRIFSIGHINLSREHLVGPKPWVNCTQIRKSFQ